MKNNLLQYKGFYGSVSFSAPDEIFYGKVEGIDDLVSFEGGTVKELKRRFQEAVDDYILFCKKKGAPLLKSYKGSFNIRIKPETHQLAALTAIMQNISLNQFVQQAIDRELALAEDPVKEYFKTPTAKKPARNSKGAVRKA